MLDKLRKKMYTIYEVEEREGIKMKIAKVTKKEFEFDREGMKFPVSETLYYYTAKASDIVKYNKKLMSEDDIEKCLQYGKSYEWVYLKNQLRLVYVTY